MRVSDAFHVSIASVVFTWADWRPFGLAFASLAPVACLICTFLVAPAVGCFSVIAPVDFLLLVSCASFAFAVHGLPSAIALLSLLAIRCSRRCLRVADGSLHRQDGP